MDQQRLDVLAIDDNPDDLELLRRLLGRVPHWDLDFHGFDASAPAVDYLRDASGPPDVVLLDF
ncbi:MAG: response regulator, partial [Phycisphaeraceae bacterium]|nr:response regulator [Phycisphaeraceae bacterium]